MNIIAQFDEVLLQALGWTLFHSLWQILLIGLIIKLSLWLFRNYSPAVRLNLLFAGIIGILIVTGITFYTLYSSAVANHEFPGIISQINELEQPQKLQVSESPVIAFDMSLFNKMPAFLNQNIHLVSIFWLLGFFVFAIRLTGGYWYLERMKRNRTALAEQAIQKISNDILNRFNLKKQVKILESAWVKIPIVLGYFKPVIILPAGLATSIPFNQLEAILAHELAHIKRNDFLINLVKSVLEAIFFYHPVFWWISKQIDNEREHCCDDLTLSVCENKKSLQEALLNIELYNQKPQPVAAALYKNKFQLLKRIKRMKTQPQSNQKNHRRLAGLMIVPVLVIIFGLASAFVPRSADLPDMAIQKSPVGPANSNNNHEDLLQEKQLVKLKEAGQQTLSTTAKKSTTVALPDTTKVKYGSKIKTDDGYVLLEFDENMNLQQITKNGNKLTGEEREKYEKIAIQAKKAYHNELNQNKNDIELQQLQEQLSQVQEKMAQVQEEYGAIMKEYIEKTVIASENAWPEAYANVFDEEQLARLEELGNHQWVAPDFEMPPMPDIKMPPMPEFNVNEDALREQFEQMHETYEDMAEEFERQKEDWLKESQLPEKKLLLEKEARALEHDARVLELESHRLENGLKKELLHDGLINEWDDLKSFNLSTKKLKVNGKKQSKELHKKYLRIYEDITGKELEGHMEINRD